MSHGKAFTGPSHRDRARWYQGRFSPTADITSPNTARDVNEKIDAQIDASIQSFHGKSETDIHQRLYELDREWDIERMLEMMASSFSLMGLALGRGDHKRWLIFPTIVLSFLWLHAVQGWCPPVPVLRRLGFRTMQEIDRERYALKAILEARPSY